MRHYVTIQEIVRTKDGIGGFNESWEDVISVFSSVEPIMAKQQYEYRSINVDATHRIKMSGLVEINEKQRIKFGTRNFEILTIEDIQERQFLKVITCKEVRS